MQLVGHGVLYNMSPLPTAGINNPELEVEPYCGSYSDHAFPLGGPAILAHLDCTIFEKCMLGNYLLLSLTQFDIFP
jgi:hypothetical protein